MDALWEESEAWADSQLEGSSTASAEEVEKGLQTSLQSETVQEIEAFLGRQSIANFDFEAVEMAVRRAGFRPGRARAGTTAQR